MLSKAEVAELLETLHANGYRLRKIGPDTLEVVEAGPSLTISPEQERDARAAQLQLEREEFEADKYAHVGGKPAWLKSPQAQSAVSPWKDNEGRNA